MFERYTEKARRVIFFARYEASQWGANHIEVSHLLLALLREDKALFMKMLGTMAPFDHVTDLLGLKLEGEKISTSVDLPLAAEAKRVLKFAAEEATAMSMENIAPAHLLIGMFREPSAARDLLQKLGLDSVKVRAAMQGAVEGPTSVQIVTALRLQFGSLTSRLKPEMEPAVVYSLNREKVK